MSYTKEKLTSRSIPTEAVEAMDSHLSDNTIVKVRWLGQAILEKIERDKEINSITEGIRNGTIQIVNNPKTHGPNEFK